MRQVTAVASRIFGVDAPHQYSYGMGWPWVHAQPPQRASEALPADPRSVPYRRAVPAEAGP